MISKDQCGSTPGGSRSGSREYLLWGLVAFIVAVPYFKGLYFEKERFIAGIAAFLLFLTWLCVSSRSRGVRLPNVFLEAPPGIASVALFTAYLIAVPLAASLRSATGEALTMGFVVCVSWLAAELVSRERHLDMLLGAAGVSGVIVALVGMATATQVLAFPSAWETQTGRLYSTLQYPNTAASMLMAAYYAILTVCLKSTGVLSPSPAAPHPHTRSSDVAVAMWAGAGTLVFAGFILTQSRGAWLVFPVVALMYVLGLPRGARMISGLFGLITGALGAFTATRFVRYLDPVQPVRAWSMAVGVCLAGAAITMLGVRLFARGVRRNKDSNGECPPRKGPAVRMAAIISVVVAVAGAVSTLVVLARRGMLTGPLGRIAQISLSEASARERLMWTADAFRIALDHPLTGVGGGGWAMVYHRYKAYPYYTRLAHNHFAQVVADTGFTGLVAYICVWLTLLVTLWNVLRRPGEEGVKVSTWGAGMIAVALGIHGTLDFNLSIPAVPVLLWAMVGTVIAGARLLGVSAMRGSGWGWLRGAIPRRIAAGVAAFALLFTVSLTISGFVAVAGMKAWAEGMPDEAIRLMQTACAFDPLSASLKADLGQYCEIVGEQRRDAELLRRCVRNFSSAVRLNPYETGIRLHYASVLSKMGQLQAAISNARAVIENNRFLGQGYEVLTGLYVEMGKRAALSGSPEDARSAFRQGLDVLQQLADTNDRVPEDLRGLSVAGPGAEITSTMRLYIAQAHFFLGQLDAAMTELNLAGQSPDRGIAARALFWQALCEATTGERAGPGKKMQEAIKVVPGIASEGPRARDICKALGLPYNL